MRHAISLIDAFAEGPFTGNPAAVLLLDAPLDAATMQAVAAEMAQPETAFAVPLGGDAWDLRWFSPTQEVDFCGHATLATAHAIAEAGQGAEAIAFHTAAGVLRVGVEGDGRYALDLPRGEPVPTRLHEMPFAVSGYRAAFEARDVMCVELESAGDVRAFRPDMRQIADTFPGGLCLTAPGLDADIHSRFFWPAGGIPEDAVTGSLHATLVPFWAPRFKSDRVTATQGGPRRGRLEGRLAGDRVILTGLALTTLSGHIDLPDRGA